MDNLITNPKLMASLVVAMLCYLCIMCAALFVTESNKDRHINLLVVTIGTSSGWLGGILLAPYPEEAKEFAKYSTLIYTFVSGYFVAKIDGLISKALSPDTILLMSSQAALRVGIFVASTTTSTILTYVFRRYMDEFTIPF